LQHPYARIAYITLKHLKHLKHIFATYGRGRQGLVDFGHWGGIRRRARTTSTGHARGCPWLGRGGPKAPRHVCPSDHGGVSGMPDDDERRMDGEGASGVVD
jgi:hypothetical protein